MSKAQTSSPQRVAIWQLLGGKPPSPPKPAARPNIQDTLEEVRAQGEAQGLAKAQPHIDKLESDIGQLQVDHSAEIEKLHQHYQALISAQEHAFVQAVASLGHAAAKAVLTHEPSLTLATLESLLTETIHGLTKGVLHAHPDNIATISQILPKGWTLNPNSDLAIGTLEAEVGALLQQASLSNRLSLLFPEIQTNPQGPSA